MALYKFLVSMPVDTLLPRDAFVNTFHMQHAADALVQTDADSLANSVVDMYQARYGSTTGEVRCRIYKVGPAPQYPVADKVKGLGNFWSASWPREIAVCLSYSGANSGDPTQRGRIYLSPNIKIGGAFTIAQRPSVAVRDWALDFYRISNGSFPDLGGVDWKFGVYSPSSGKFTQTTKAWVDDEWDTVRSRGLRPSARSAVTRDG